MNSTFLRKIAIALFLMTIPAGFIYAATYPSKDELYRGVYWAGEYTYKGEANRWAKVDSALKQLGALNMNAIWLTHTSAADAAEFSRLGAAYGIKIVASLARLAWDESFVRLYADRDYIAGEIAAYGNAPLPIAWGLGDEMIGSISTMPSYVAMWRTNFPGVPITATFMWNNVPAAGAMNFDYLTCDFYPFFADHSPNGPWGGNSASWWIDRLRDVTSHTDTSAMHDRPWFIPQGFQETNGPFNLDAQGHIVYLPGGGSIWPMPTTAQITWQALTAVAHGVKGLFYFMYRAPIEPNDTAKNWAGPCSEPGCEQTTRPSNSPRSLGYPDGRTTPQLLALGSAYAWIMSLDSAIKTAKVSGSTGLVGLRSDPAEYGTFSKVLYDRRTDKHIYFIVASYLGTVAYSYDLVLAPHMRNVADAATRQPLTLDTAGGFYRLTRSINPGMAAAITFMVDSSNLPVSFEDDFSTSAALSYARASQSMAWYQSHGAISAANAGIIMGDAYIVFNVDSLLGATMAASGLRQLEYDGAAVPDQGLPEHGVRWSVSNDGTIFTEISSNEFGRLISFSGKYLRANLSFSQTDGPEYGSLSWFKISQWRNKAGSGTAAQVRNSGVDLHASMLPQSAPSLRELGRLMQQGGYAVRLYNVNGSLIWAGRGMATPPDHLVRSNGIVIIEIKHLQTGALKQWRTASVR